MQEGERGYSGGNEPDMTHAHSVSVTKFLRMKELTETQNKESDSQGSCKREKKKSTLNLKPNSISNVELRCICFLKA